MNLVRWSRIFARIWDQLEREIEKRGLPDRSIAPLSDAAIGYKLRNATYRKTADVELVVAGRDLRHIADAGLLVPQGERRGRYYIASEALRKIGQNAHEPFVEQDPFTMTDYLPGLAPV